MPSIALNIVYFIYRDGELSTVNYPLPPSL